MSLKEKKFFDELKKIWIISDYPEYIEDPHSYDTFIQIVEKQLLSFSKLINQYETLDFVNENKNTPLMVLIEQKRFSGFIEIVVDSNKKLGLEHVNNDGISTFTMLLQPMFLEYDDTDNNIILKILKRKEPILITERDIEFIQSIINRFHNDNHIMHKILSQINIRNVQPLYDKEEKSSSQTSQSRVFGNRDLQKQINDFLGGRKKRTKMKKLQRSVSTKHNNKYSKKKKIKHIYLPYMHI